MTADGVVSVTLNKSVTISVNTTDQDGDNVTVYLLSDPGGATVERVGDNTAVVHFTPLSLQPEPLR